MRKASERHRAPTSPSNAHHAPPHAPPHGTLYAPHRRHATPSAELTLSTIRPSIDATTPGHERTQTPVSPNELNKTARPANRPPDTPKRKNKTMRRTEKQAEKRGEGRNEKRTEGRNGAKDGTWKRGKNSPQYRHRKTTRKTHPVSHAIKMRNEKNKWQGNQRNR